jgi:dinuclear metal center YbgI/SA1388 family protein
MKLSDFISIIEGFAPVSLALEYDNAGLLIGTKKQDIQSVLVALDCTEKVAEEAARIGADLVLTHHPVFFKGIKRILPDDPETCAAYTLIRHGIALYAAHTNLDAAAGGVNDVLADRLGLRNVRSLPPEDLGRIGDIPVTSLYDFAQRVEKILDTRVSVTGNKDSIVETVAVVGGGGDGDIIYAANAGADVFVTGELGTIMPWKLSIWAFRSLPRVIMKRSG